MTSSFAPRFVYCLSVSMALSILVSDAIAQSGSGGGARYSQPRSSGSGQARSSGSAAGSGAAGSGTAGSSAAGSGSAGAATGPVALGGYCAICLANDRQWVTGRPEYAVNFDGKRYLFPSPEQQQAFRANPAQFAPALGGDDVVEFARSGRRVVGQLPLGAAYQGRFYFFASDANKQAFLSAPAQFANADLALGGECIVCRVDMNQQMAGSPAINAVYQGVRYQFPGEDQRNRFLANPSRYAAVAKQLGSGSRGSGSAPRGSGAQGSGAQGSGAQGSGAQGSGSQGGSGAQGSGAQGSGAGAAGSGSGGRGF